MYYKKKDTVRNLCIGGVVVALLAGTGIYLEKNGSFDGLKALFNKKPNNELEQTIDYKEPEYVTERIETDYDETEHPDFIEELDENVESLTEPIGNVNPEDMEEYLTEIVQNIESNVYEIAQYMYSKDVPLNGNLYTTNYQFYSMNGFDNLALRFWGEKFNGIKEHAYLGEGNRGMIQDEYIDTIHELLYFIMDNEPIYVGENEIRYTDLSSLGRFVINSMNLSLVRNDNKTDSYAHGENGISYGDLIEFLNAENENNYSELVETRSK